jgi:hypothetical protein
MGVVLLMGPWIFGFSRDGAETWVPVLLGAALLLYSLFTDYETGLMKNIPMTAHLWLDVISGAVLVLSPWLFGFSDFVWAPHVLLGLIEIGAGVTTQTIPSHEAFTESHSGAI